MTENDRFRFSNFDELFGELHSVHHSKLTKFQTIVVPAILFLLFLGGIVAYRASGDFWTLPVCALPFFLLFCGVIWSIFGVRRSELRIYENGFSFRGRKNFQTCLWSELHFYDFRELNELEKEETNKKNRPLGYVVKQSGEKIDFGLYLTGTPLIAEKFKKFKSELHGKSEKPKNKK